MCGFAKIPCGAWKRQSNGGHQKLREHSSGQNVELSRTAKNKKSTRTVRIVRKQVKQWADATRKATPACTLMQHHRNEEDARRTWDGKNLNETRGQFPPTPIRHPDFYWSIIIIIIIIIIITSATDRPSQPCALQRTCTMRLILTAMPTYP